MNDFMYFVFGIIAAIVMSLSESICDYFQEKRRLLKSLRNKEDSNG